MTMLVDEHYLVITIINNSHNTPKGVSIPMEAQY